MDTKTTPAVTGIRWWVWAICAGLLALVIALVWQPLSTPDKGERDVVGEAICRKPAGSRGNGDLIMEYALEDACRKFAERRQGR